MNKLLLALLLLSFNVSAMEEYETLQLKRGYDDGCASGHFIAGSSYFKHKKDNDDYEGKPYYKEGWDIGYERCKIEQMRLQGIITDSLKGGWR